MHFKANSFWFFEYETSDSKKASADQLIKLGDKCYWLAISIPVASILKIESININLALIASAATFLAGFFFTRKGLQLIDEIAKSRV